MGWTSSEIVVLPISLLVIVLVTVALGFLLRGKSDKVRQIPFIVLAAIVLVLEVVKQILAFPNYSLWTLPLHFCSTFLFWYMLAGFFKGKVSEVGFTLSVLFGFLFIALFYFDPSSIIGNSAANIFQSFGSFHTFFYHHTIILFTILAIVLKKFQPKKNHIVPIILIYTAYAATSILGANLLQVNFTNLLHSSIGFMQSLLDSCGHIFYTFMMYLIGLAGLLAGFSVSYYLPKLNKKTKDKRVVK